MRCRWRQSLTHCLSDRGWGPPPCLSFTHSPHHCLLAKHCCLPACRKYHPDRNPDMPDAEEKFRDIAAAYEVLSGGWCGGAGLAVGCGVGGCAPPACALRATVLICTVRAPEQPPRRQAGPGSAALKSISECPACC